MIAPAYAADLARIAELVEEQDRMASAAVTALNERRPESLQCCLVTVAQRAQRVNVLANELERRVARERRREPRTGT